MSEPAESIFPPQALSIDAATVEDVPTLLSFIRGLAEYEKLTAQCTVTEQALTRTLFGARPFAEALIARWNYVAIGYALFFHDYSTFLAAPGVYLEDLFVLPEHRGRGAGKALLRRVVQLAAERGCGRVEWSVLDWNQPAIEFYQRSGATVLPDWRICRMTLPQNGALPQDRIPAEPAAAAASAGNIVANPAGKVAGKATAP